MYTILESKGLDYLGDGVKSEKSKWQRTDLCGIQHEGVGLKKEVPVQETIKK